MDIHQPDVKHLETAAEDFFAEYGTSRLLGGKFMERLEQVPGETLFCRFLKICGYENDPAGFFKALAGCAGSNQLPVGVSGVEIPVLFIYRMLEILFPGNRLHAVKKSSHLEAAAFVSVKNPSRLQQVLDIFPVRLSDHVIRQSLVSKAVAGQYLPFEGELDDTGDVITFDGHFKNGVVEQMYRNRVIFLLDMSCPVYCRFCFRKHKSKRKEKAPEKEDVLEAVDHVRRHPSIHEVLITGGEPLWNRANIETAVDGLMDIAHVNAVRIATRSVFYYPELFLENNSRYINYLVDKNSQYREFGKRIEIGVHVVHPDEISLQSLEIISRLVKNGVQVYVQTPFLEGVNTDGESLGRVFSLLRQAGAQIYYIFTPCSPIHGTKTYWSPIRKSVEAQRLLRENFSDRLVPKLCTATSLGKIEWHTSGWAVEKDRDDPEYTWIRTPYTLDYFREFIRDVDDMPDWRVNREGTLDARYRLDMGDENLICGSRKSRDKDTGQKIELSWGDVENRIFNDLYHSPFPAPPVSPSPHTGICRVHKTRVEIFLESEERLDQSLEYIGESPQITDVVVCWNGNPSDELKRIRSLTEKLKKFSHVACLRLRSSAFALYPEAFTEEIIQGISVCSDFSIGMPFRVEIESWFFKAGQVTGEHAEIAGRFIDSGVNVYANSAMLPGINDMPDEMLELAYALRKAKIEFHHLYAAGMEIHKSLGVSLQPQKVIDIASRLRAECSGRQIPLYMVRTPEGERDFGLDPLFIPFSP